MGPSGHERSALQTSMSRIVQWRMLLPLDDRLPRSALRRQWRITRSHQRTALQHRPLESAPWLHFDAVSFRTKARPWSATEEIGAWRQHAAPPKHVANMFLDVDLDWYFCFAKRRC